MIPQKMMRNMLAAGCLATALFNSSFHHYSVSGLLMESNVNGDNGNGNQVNNQVNEQMFEKFTEELGKHVKNAAGTPFTPELVEQVKGTLN
jgi:hypothetical protein